MFTPSATRLTTPTTRDWLYAENWIDQHACGQSMQFERNADTLRALLSLATFSQAAEDKRRILNRASAETNTTMTHTTRQQHIALDGYSRELMSIIEQTLPETTRAGIHSHVTTVCSLGEQRRKLLAKVLALQTEINASGDTSERTSSLETQLSREVFTILDIGQQVRESLGHSFQFASESGQLRQAMDIPVTFSVENANACSTTHRREGVRVLVEDVIGVEQDYLSLLKQKKNLDLRLAAFQGIQMDPGEAKADIDALRNQLEGMLARRDVAFDGLVQRESPGKKL